VGCGVSRGLQCVAGCIYDEHLELVGVLIETDRKGRCVCCSVLQCVAVCCSVLHDAFMMNTSNVLVCLSNQTEQTVAMCCGVLQRVAVCCRVCMQ